MNVRLEDILSLYKQTDVDDFLKALTGHNLNEPSLSLDDIKDHWACLGNTTNNGSSVDMLRKGENGLIERITNAIDAVVEKQKTLCGITTAKNAGVIISKAFPKYYENCQELRKGSDGKTYAKDASNQVILAVTDAKKSSNRINRRTIPLDHTIA